MNKPHTITIYNKLPDDTYAKKVLHNVYWYGSDSVNVSGKGIVESSSINIIIEGENLNDYVDYHIFNSEDFEYDHQKYTIQDGLRIVYGEGPDIYSINELSDAFKQITITSFNENIVGSSLDNLYITGR